MKVHVSFVCNKMKYVQYLAAHNIFRIIIQNINFQEGFRKKLAEALQENTRKCEEIAAEQARRVAQRHNEEIERHEIR